MLFRSTTIGDGPVIHDRAHWGRHFFADSAGERRRAFAIEITLEPMANRFVKKDTWPPRAQNHSHRACRRVDGIQIDQRLSHRLSGKVASAIVFEQPLITEPSAAASCVALSASAAATASLICAKPGSLDAAFAARALSSSLALVAARLTAPALEPPPSRRSAAAVRSLVV